MRLVPHPRSYIALNWSLDVNFFTELVLVFIDMNKKNPIRATLIIHNIKTKIVIKILLQFPFFAHPLLAMIQSIFNKPWSVCEIKREWAIKNSVHGGKVHMSYDNVLLYYTKSIVIYIIISIAFRNGHVHPNHSLWMMWLTIYPDLVKLFLMRYQSTCVSMISLDPKASRDPFFFNSYNFIDTHLSIQNNPNVTKKYHWSSKNPCFKMLLFFVENKIIEVQFLRVKSKFLKEWLSYLFIYINLDLDKIQWNHDHLKTRKQWNSNNQTKRKME